jgi:hypothetical protein
MKALPMTLLTLAVFATGCSTAIRTIKVDPKDLDVGGAGVDGVVYYAPVLVLIRYELTQLVDTDKNLIATAESGGCVRALQKEEIITLPDYASPMAVLQKPAMFAATEFGVTLNNGLLVSVTSKSTPQTPQLLEQVAALKDVGVLSNPSAVGTPACNSGPVVASTKRTTI